MKRDQISKNVGWHMRLRPIARRPNPAGELPREDDDWLIQKVDAQGVHVRNTRTAHGTILGCDQIHNFTSDPARDNEGKQYGFLRLRVQLYIHPNRIEIEPLVPGEWDTKDTPPPGPPPMPKAKILRSKANIPTGLPRISTGKQLVDLISGMYSSDFDHDELRTQAESDLVGGFLELLSECGENIDEVGFGHRTDMGLELNARIAELAGAGFGVYGAREKQELTLDGKPSGDWLAVIVRVVRQAPKP